MYLLSSEKTRIFMIINGLHQLSTFEKIRGFHLNVEDVSLNTRKCIFPVILVIFDIPTKFLCVSSLVYFELFVVPAKLRSARSFSPSVDMEILPGSPGEKPPMATPTIQPRRKRHLQREDVWQAYDTTFDIHIGSMLIPALVILLLVAGTQFRLLALATALALVASTLAEKPMLTLLLTWLSFPFSVVCLVFTLPRLFPSTAIYTAFTFTLIYTILLTLAWITLHLTASRRTIPDLLPSLRLLITTVAPFPSSVLLVSAGLPYLGTHRITFLILFASAWGLFHALRAAPHSDASTHSHAHSYNAVSQSGMTPTLSIQSPSAPTVLDGSEPRPPLPLSLSLLLGLSFLLTPLLAQLVQTFTSISNSAVALLYHALALPTLLLLLVLLPRSSPLAMPLNHRNAPTMLPTVILVLLMFILAASFNTITGYLRNHLILLPISPALAHVLLPLSLGPLLPHFAIALAALRVPECRSRRVVDSSVPAASSDSSSASNRSDSHAASITNSPSSAEDSDGAYDNDVVPLLPASPPAPTPAPTRTLMSVPAARFLADHMTLPQAIAFTSLAVPLQLGFPPYIVMFFPLLSRFFLDRLMTDVPSITQFSVWLLATPPVVYFFAAKTFLFLTDMMAQTSPTALLVLFILIALFAVILTLFAMFPSPSLDAPRIPMLIFPNRATPVLFPSLCALVFTAQATLHPLHPFAWPGHLTLLVAGLLLLCSSLLSDSPTLSRLKLSSSSLFLSIRLPTTSLAISRAIILASTFIPLLPHSHSPLLLLPLALAFAPALVANRTPITGRRATLAILLPLTTAAALRLPLIQPLLVHLALPHSLASQWAAVLLSPAIAALLFTAAAIMRPASSVSSTTTTSSSSSSSSSTAAPASAGAVSARALAITTAALFAASFLLQYTAPPLLTLCPLPPGLLLQPDGTLTPNPEFPAYSLPFFSILSETPVESTSTLSYEALPANQVVTSFLLSFVFQPTPHTPLHLALLALPAQPPLAAIAMPLFLLSLLLTTICLTTQARKAAPTLATAAGAALGTSVPLLLFQFTLPASADADASTSSTALWNGFLTLSSHSAVLTFLATVALTYALAANTIAHIASASAPTTSSAHTPSLSLLRLVFFPLLFFLSVSALSLAQSLSTVNAPLVALQGSNYEAFTAVLLAATVIHAFAWLAVAFTTKITSLQSHMLYAPSASQPSSTSSLLLSPAATSNTLVVLALGVLLLGHTLCTKAHEITALPLSALPLLFVPPQQTLKQLTSVPASMAKPFSLASLTALLSRDVLLTPPLPSLFVSFALCIVATLTRTFVPFFSYVLHQSLAVEVSQTLLTPSFSQLIIICLSLIACLPALMLTLPCLAQVTRPRPSQLLFSLLLLIFTIIMAPLRMLKVLGMLLGLSLIICVVGQK